jgi:hypothetical protein
MCILDTNGTDDTLPAHESEDRLRAKTLDALTTARADMTRFLEALSALRQAAQTSGILRLPPAASGVYAIRLAEVTSVVESLAESLAVAARFFDDEAASIEAEGSHAHA